MTGQDAPGAEGLSRRTLIVDLDPTTLILLERLFEDEGFETATTWSMREACVLLEKGSFDLIVVGDHPPQIDAHAVLCRLETLSKLVPCIVMRAPAQFPVEPKWKRLVTTLPGCVGSEVLKHVYHHLDLITSTEALRLR